MKKRILPLILVFLTSISFAKNEVKPTVDCSKYATTMIAGIEKHFRCLDSDNYQEAYNTFMFVCRFFSTID